MHFITCETTGQVISPVFWDEGTPAPGSGDGTWFEARAEPHWSHSAVSPPLSEGKCVVFKEYQ